MKLINLTPHMINVVDPDGNVVDIPVSGTVARCSQSNEQIGEVNGIPIRGLFVRYLRAINTRLLN